MAAGKRTAVRKGAGAAGPAGGKTGRKPELILVLRDDLSGLRASLNEIMENFKRRVEGRLGTLEALLQETGERGAPTRPPQARVLRAMLARTRSLQIKTDRGRLRDLDRIQKLAEELWTLLPPED